MDAKYLTDKFHYYIEPIHCRLRKHRIKNFGCAGAAAPPVADLDFQSHCVDAACLANLAETKSYLTKYNHVATWADPASRRRPTACIMDLGAFATFSDYATAVSRQSHGNDNRYVKKAGRKGYRSRIVERDAYGASILAIHRSKLFRSGGLVFDALLAPKQQPSDRLAEPAPMPVPMPKPMSAPPACHQHWMMSWGVFAPDGERLVAYAWIERSGNLVRTLDLMGHGDFIRDGVVKLLFFDIMQWLLDRQDPCVQGLRYFLYGAVEHGRQGLFEWKQRLQFNACLLP
jgi:hypothetical protein